MPWHGRGLSAILALNPRIARVSVRVLKFETDVFPSVFECLWVPSLAINAHEINRLRYIWITVTAEVAGSSPVVPAIQSKELSLVWHPE